MLQINLMCSIAGIFQRYNLWTNIFQESPHTKCPRSLNRYVTRQITYDLNISEKTATVQTYWLIEASFSWRNWNLFIT